MCIDKNQIFHKFSDGVEFKPDIGRIKQLGEVFTPYPIVIKMIKDIGLAKDKSNATVLEPASGHGNFGVEILNFKIQQVLKEMKQDNVSEKDWTKEYEIRSLLALASLYQNDINGQNINELINRLAPFILSMYKKYTKNKKNEISQHYHIAMTNILSANCIKADFTTSQKWRIKFIFYFRNGDYIYRVRKSLYDLEQTKILDKNEGYKISMFQDEPSLTINDADIIKYDKWHEKINTKNFWELTEELKMSKDKIMRERIIMTMMSMNESNKI